MSATSTAVRRRNQKLRSQSIREDVRGGDRLRVDRQAGVIYGVKVLGLDSDNSRRYLPDAVRRAAPLYEGRSVRINHPRRPDDSRESEDVFGWLESVHIGQDGALYGNLCFLTSHPMAERIAEAAEKNPRLFGLSHNAEGQGDTQDGVFVVHEITEVRSVDLVADPATTRGLFEDRSNRRMKLKAFFEAINLEAKQRQAVLSLFEAGKCLHEMDGYAMEGEDMQPEKMGHMDALHQGFRAAQHALVDEDDMPAADKSKRMGELMKAHEKMCSDGQEDVAEEEEGEGEGEEEEASERKKMESKDMRRTLQQLQARDRCRDLCEEASIVPSKSLLKALVALESDDDRKALIEECRGPGSTRTRATKPRSQAPGTAPLTEARLPEKPEDVLAWLRN